VDRAPNIRDVARVAGVSYQTVSRALNGSSRIRPETLARVNAAIAQLGYRPNQVARALGTGRTRTIGVLAARAEYYGPMTAIHAIELAARAAGYRLSIVTSDDAVDRASLDHLLAQSVDALVVLAPQLRVLDALDALELGVPTVRLDATGVAIDQVAGARLATRHLTDLGHRRIVHLAGPADWSDAVGRAAGFAQELQAAGLAPVSAAVAGDWTAESGYRIGRELLPAHGFTAAFAANDQMALGLIHAARELGRDVPGDLSVVGFDDIPEAAHFLPPLTTIRQDFGLIGRRAVELLVAALEGAERPPGGLVVPELVVRASTGPVG
jgi:DNA-binding LacI/PurR family transcriptional regulator